MRPTPEELRAEQGELYTTVRNMVRRVLLAEAVEGRWGIEGYEQGDGTFEGAGELEAEGVDIFSGIGIYAKPGTDDDAEGVMLHVGGHAAHRVLVAQRNEEARARYVAEHGDIAAGEIAIFNSDAGARMVLKASGDIELTPAAGQKAYIKRKGGTAVPLATKADVDAIATFLKLHFDTLIGHKHPVIGGPPATLGTGSGAGYSVPAAAGTSATEAE